MDVFIGRKDDIGLLVKQDNATREIVIDAVQGSPEALMETLGYEPFEIESQSFLKLVPARISELIDDYVEFDELGNDLLNVIKRTPRFAMVSKDGDYVEMDLRIQYGVMGANPRFIMLASSKAKHVNACVAALEEYRDNDVLDPVLEISNRESFLARCDIIQQFVDDKGLKASYAVAQIEGYSELLRSVGEVAADALVVGALAQFQRTFRATDVLGSLGQGRIGLGLLKADASDVAIPFQRLFGAINGVETELSGYGSAVMTGKVVAYPAVKEIRAAAAVQACEDALPALESGGIQVIA